MDSETLELILKAKDEASAIVNNLRVALESVPAAAGHVRTATDEVSAAFETLKISTTASIEAQKAAVNSAYLSIKHSGTATAEEIQRAEAARAKAIEEIDARNFAARKGLLDRLKEHWVAVTGAIVAAWASVNQAKEFIDLGAAALQAEESFHRVTQSYQVDGDALLAKMKQVSAGIIDDSDLMQRAVRALQQGLNPDQIVSLLEVARSSARVAGIDVASAFDRITEATANQMTRGLKALGIVIDQNKAFEDYANRLGIAKEALNEQQQSQALANAAIEEGRRQMTAMGPLMDNESERLQRNRAHWRELKEEIGKGLLSVLGVARENIDGVMVALSAAALYNAPRAIAAIIASFQGLAAASGAAALAMKSSLVAAAAIIGYELGKAVDSWVYKLAGIDLSGLNRPMENVKRLTAENAKLTSELTDRLAQLGFTGPDTWEKYEKAVKAGVVVTNEAGTAQTNLLKLLQDWIPVVQAQTKTMEAEAKLMIDLVKEDFEQGRITMDAYVSFVKQKQDEITQAQISAAEMRIEAIKKEEQTRMITADESRAKIAAVEEEIRQIRINAAAENRRIDQEAVKIRDQGIEDRKKKEEEAFSNWKTLQDLRLQTLKGMLDLEAAQDDAALKRGEMRQSEALERKLARMRQYYEQEIALASQTAEQIAQRTGLNTEKDIVEYEQAMAKRAQLQLEYEATVVRSEQEISEARQQEAQQAVQVAEETASTVGAAWTTQVEDVGKAAADILEFYQALSRSIVRGMGDWTPIITYWVQKLRDVVRKEYGEVLDTIYSMVGKARGGFDILGAMGIRSLEQGEMLLRQLYEDAERGLDVFYYHMRAIGNQTISTVGMTAKEWVQRVAEYVNYVKGLLMSLKEQISGYQDQLDELRGNDEAILDRWYEKERAALEEKYAKDLSSYAEYQEALKLLDEIYAEKKKQLRERELEETRQFYDDIGNLAAGAGEGGGTTSGGSTAGGGSSSPFNPGDIMNNPRYNPWLGLADKLNESVAKAVGSVQEAFGEGVSIGQKEINVKKSVDFTANIQMPALDRDGTGRWFEDEFWPLFTKKLKLKGIDL